MTSDPFVRELAHLVWLLVYRPGHLDVQKSVLRSLRTSGMESAARIEQSELAAAVADSAGRRPLAESHPWLAELSTRMAVHTVRVIESHSGATAAELLGLARALASAGDSEDPGHSFDEQFVALQAQHLAVQLGRHGFQRTPTPPMPRLAYGASTRTPANGTTPVEEAMREHLAARVTPSALEPVRVAPPGKPAIATEELMPARHVDDLVIRLRGEITPVVAPALLDEVTRVLEDAAREGSWTAVVDLVSRVLAREESVTQPDVKRAFGIVFKRLAKPGILRGVAQLLPSHRDLRDAVQQFLVRQGEPAADIIVDLLITAEPAGDRRAYRDALRGLPAAVDPLRQLLRDHRWFVVRNAAELLGEMNAVAADEDLVETLRHRDARVRHAATLALIRLGTPRAGHTILRALGDPDASVRLKAVHGIARVNHARAVPALLAALDAESDEEIRNTLVLALARHPVDAAVQRLSLEASPGSFFRRRPQARRLVAVQALGEMQSEASRLVLAPLARDRDGAVRDLAARLLADGPR
ncbi:MAG: HEAT repeat domain-containing protein [Gemmatimonadaceae bacterium]|nr:HEAT repeat domain-containing protein [Gemmatimonadaceae bacterium]